MPRTLTRFELTGYTVPPKGLLIRFQSILRPTLPAFSVAPMTATDLGEKNTCKALNSAVDEMAIKYQLSGLSSRVPSKFVKSAKSINYVDALRVLCVSNEVLDSALAAVISSNLQ